MKEPHELLDDLADTGQQLEDILDNEDYELLDSLKLFGINLTDLFDPDERSEMLDPHEDQHAARIIAKIRKAA